nr:MAG: Tyrosine phosphatase family protein [Bacteriophage sp.]
MAEYLTNTADLTAVANAIRAKGGTAKQLVYPSGFVSAIQAIKTDAVESIEWHQCPQAVRNYLANVTYNPNDYSTSQIADYAPAEAVVGNYKPIGQEAGGTMHYNEVPNMLTPFAGNNAAGTLKPLDALRWIRTRDNSAEAWNVRDLGGWACDGGTVKYGLLIRGGKLAAADRAVLVGELGVQHDLDLRGREGGGSGDEPDMTESPLGSDVWYTRTQQYAWYALTPVATWQAYLRCVIDAVTHREPVYFHCTAGADRTGTLACVLEGLLGMTQSDIDKDYELTTFYSGSGSDATARRRNESDWKGLINEINAVSGDTFRDKCVHFAVGTCGMSLADINAYRAAMINGTPETLHWYQSITKNLTGCTISNAAYQVDYGEAYTATLTPENGKTMTSVVIKMGGVDITATAYSAGSGAINIAKVTGAITITAAASAPSVNYTITRNLTNCASSNTANTIAEGAAYTTTLSPTGTYKKLGAITVTMGGTDISASAVSGSTITIAKVTGNIVITCAAEITNIIDTIGISANTRLSTSSGANRTQSGYAAIGANEDAASLIHLKAGDMLRIKGASLPASNDSYSAVALHNANGTFNTSTYLHSGLTWNGMTFANSGNIVTVKATTEHYIRVSLICTDASAVIATINEEIS